MKIKVSLKDGNVIKDSYLIESLLISPERDYKPHIDSTFYIKKEESEGNFEIFRQDINGIYPVHSNIKFEESREKLYNHALDYAQRRMRQLEEIRRFEVTLEDLTKRGREGNLVKNL